MTNSDYEGFTSHEIEYLEKINEIGMEKGDCKELQLLCQKAHEEYEDGIISSAAYGKIYVTCMDYAYPR